MDTPTLLEWLDSKIPAAKLIPPPAVVAERLRDETRAVIRRRLVDEALLHARVDERTGQALDGLLGEMQRTQARLTSAIKKKLATDPALPWTTPVMAAAANLAEHFAKGQRR